MNIHKLLVKAVGGTDNGPVDLSNVFMRYGASYYHLRSISTNGLSLMSLGIITTKGIRELLKKDIDRFYETQKVLTLSYDTMFVPVSVEVSSRLSRIALTIIEVEARHRAS